VEGDAMRRRFVLSTASELKARITAELEAAGIEPAEVRREAELIIEYATGWQLAEQFLRDSDPVSIESVRLVLDVIEGRKKRVPLQYLFGYAYFLGLKLTVRPGVLIPREDTETLVLVALERMVQMDSPHIAEIGTGSGAVSIAILERRHDVTISGIDITADAVVLTRENALLYNVLNRLKILYDDWENVLPFELSGIISNPPYIPESDKSKLLPEVAKYEPAEALFGSGLDGLDFYRKLSHKGIEHLTSGGFFAVEVGDKQAEAVAAIFKKQGWRDIQVRQDLNGISRVVSGLKPTTP
jgi:release factor glutamine methyltransferase